MVFPFTTSATSAARAGTQQCALFAGLVYFGWCGSAFHFSWPAASTAASRPVHTTIHVAGSRVSTSSTSFPKVTSRSVRSARHVMLMGCLSARMPVVDGRRGQQESPDGHCRGKGVLDPHALPTQALKLLVIREVLIILRLVDRLLLHARHQEPLLLHERDAELVHRLEPLVARRFGFVHGCLGRRQRRIYGRTRCRECRLHRRLGIEKPLAVALVVGQDKRFHIIFERRDGPAVRGAFLRRHD